MGRGPAADAGSEVTVLVDTSVWIEYFRDTGVPGTAFLQKSADSDGAFRTCGPVIMEVLAGARNDDDLATMTSILSRGHGILTQPEHFDGAASLYRACRAQGITVRSMIDCLIATIAMDEDVEVLHHDRDFGAIAQVIPLRIHPASIN